jgi:hypothetical protein
MIVGFRACTSIDVPRNSPENVAIAGAALTVLIGRLQN